MTSLDVRAWVQALCGYPDEDFLCGYPDEDLCGYPDEDFLSYITVGLLQGFQVSINQMHQLRPVHYNSPSADKQLVVVKD